MKKQKTHLKFLDKEYVQSIITDNDCGFREGVITSE